ncbi:MAG TPA: POTRA domain-containing protein [Puia sp.]|nr:POTRA domain-containing protein [Puia sp.]
MKYLWIILPVCLFLHTSAQSVTIGNIFIQGNRKTKTYIVERELSFKKGDTVTLSQLVSAFRTAHDRLINTHLFNEVAIYVKDFSGYKVNVEIDVKERWYIFPVPYFKPVDRNFTAWSQKHYSLSRVDYGGKFTHYNFTGRNDNLTAWLITGYARQFELFYNQPYADMSLKHGFGFGFNYIAQKELDVRTINNQQGFINSDTLAYAGRYLSQQLSFSARYFYRPRLKVRHVLNFTMVSTTIDSAVTVWNPHYLDNDKRRIIYPQLTYTLNYTDVDYVSYPLKGIIFETSLTRRGINRDMNLWLLSTRLIRSWPLAKKLWFGIENINVLKGPLSQPFYNQTLIGYGDMYIRGLDRYVIDGTAGGIVRNTLFRELLNFDIPVRNSVSHDHIPFRVYATAFSDYGYAYNRDFTNNSLVNRMLYTGGIGIDIVTFYDLSFKFDYSFNQLGQNGLFLHIRNDF